MSKMKEFREKEEKELRKVLAETQAEISQLRGKRAIGSLADTSTISKKRRGGGRGGGARAGRRGGGRWRNGRRVHGRRGLNGWRWRSRQRRGFEQGRRGARRGHGHFGRGR